MKELATLGIDRSALIAALQTQNIVRPAGIIQTRNESLSLRVSGAFRSEQDVLDVNFAVGNQMLRLPILRRSGAATPIRRSRCSVSAANRLSVSPLRCGMAATFSRLARTSSAR